jgi:acetoin utilization deacetylase AcuC-like enzyme
VRAFAQQSDIPLGAILEGGYEPRALAQSVREMLLALGDERAPKSGSADDSATERAVAQLRRYWPL